MKHLCFCFPELNSNHFTICHIRDGMAVIYSHHLGLRGIFGHIRLIQKCTYRTQYRTYSILSNYIIFKDRYRKYARKFLSCAPKFKCCTFN
jgi:hypothetical protein